MQESSRLTCDECGQENEPDSNFCRHCGSSLAIGPPAPLICAGCGKENEAGSKFCRNCGRTLTAEQPQARPGGGVASDAATSSASMVCPRCQHGNEPRSTYCYNCGLPLTDEGRRAATARQGLPAFGLGRPAGFWIRAGGLVIDTIIASAIFGLALLLFTDSSLAGYWNAQASEESFTRLDLLNSVISLGYATLLIGAFATTVGKRPFNMYILRPDGTRVGYCRALGREAAKILSFLLLGIGFLMVALRADKRALHDLIAGTVVIRR